MTNNTLTGAHDNLESIDRSHFTFEMYAPNTTSENGVSIMNRVSIQFSGQGLHLSDVLEKFEDFLRAVGYVFPDKMIDLVDR